MKYTNTITYPDEILQEGNLRITKKEKAKTIYLVKEKVPFWKFVKKFKPVIMVYAEQNKKTWKWGNIRVRAYKREQCRCQSCGSTKNIIFTKKNNKKPEKLNNMLVLCNNCSLQHDKKNYAENNKLRINISKWDDTWQCPKKGRRA